MDVFHYANKIYHSEIINHPQIIEQQEIIYVSSIIHDMCDKKYIIEEKGVKEMKDYMKEYISLEKLDVICDIVSTMSYSKVQIYGYPNLQQYQTAYHIVRESDLLAAYDIDRCIIYQMMQGNSTYTESLPKALELFDNRVLQYINDQLFISNYSKQEAQVLHIKAIKDIQYIKRLQNLL